MHSVYKFTTECQPYRIVKDGALTCGHIDIYEGNLREHSMFVVT